MFRIQDLGFEVSSLGFRVGLRLQGLEEFKVWSYEMRVFQGAEFGDYRPRPLPLLPRRSHPPCPLSEVDGSEFRV